MSETKTDWVEEVLATIEEDAKACDADAKRHKEKGDELNSYLMATQAMAHQLDIARFRKAQLPTPQVSGDLKELAGLVCSRFLSEYESEDAYESFSSEYQDELENVVINVLQPFFTHRDAETRRIMEQAKHAIESFKHCDGCFCEAAFSMGDGSHPRHSDECVNAADSINAIEKLLKSFDKP